MLGSCRSKMHRAGSVLLCVSEKLNTYTAHESFLAAFVFAVDKAGQGTQIKKKEAARGQDYSPVYPTSKLSSPHPPKQRVSYNTSTLFDPSTTDTCNNMKNIYPRTGAQSFSGVISRPLQSIECENSIMTIIFPSCTNAVDHSNLY